MLGPGGITMVRHVAVWYYVLTGVTAIVSLGWMAQRRLLGLGLRLLAAGIAVNAIWEALLFTVWGRNYETVVPTLVQVLYQSLTEFGPPLVIGVLVLDYVDGIDCSLWRDTVVTSLHQSIRQGVGILLLIVVFSCLTLVIVAPDVLLTPITVYREISWTYFFAATGLALVVLGIAVWRADRTALMLFVVLGSFNVLFEVVGVISGYRSYHGLSAFGSVFVGLAESGVAAALVWIVVEETTNFHKTGSLSPLYNW